MKILKNKFSCLINKTSLRQIISVVGILFFMVFMFTVASRQENKIEREEITYELKVKYDVDKTNKLVMPNVGWNNYIETIVIENKYTLEEPVLENKRENKIYYVSDNGQSFYLDEEYQDYLWEVLKEYERTDLYELCIALMYHESKFEKDTISATNDHGLMQVNEGNYGSLHKTLGINSLDDPYENIQCGVYLLLYGVDKFEDIETALVCYNQGDGSLDKDKNYSTEYSQSILNEDMNKLRVLIKDKEGI